jgi:hypothetical protein
LTITEQDRLSDRAQLEEMYSRFGWKWAVLAFMGGRIVGQRKQLPGDIVDDLRATRARMESGCESLCDVAADLRALEIKMFPAVLNVSEGEAHTMLELLGKAMSGSLKERDIDLSPLRPLLANATIPKVCVR